MKKIKILIADNNFLTRKGIQGLLDDNEDFLFVGEAENKTELIEKALLKQPHLLIIDHACQGFTAEDVKEFKKQFPKIQVLAITAMLSKPLIAKAMEYGVKSYLLKECDKDEITEAIYKTAQGEKFLCGKVLDVIMNETDEVVTIGASCKGLNISEREIEIIILIAEGFSNKQIADKLFLSTHTVTTHRKNIMNKLDINNTAGLVLFAVRENLISPNKYLFSN